MKKFLKKYLYLLIVLIVLLSLMLYFIFNKDEVKEERNPLEEEIVNVTEKINVIEENKKIKIDIKGAVKNPGVYELDDNTRVIDAINVSGGLTAKADTSSINLSKVLKDEMVIVIYTKDEILKAKEENVKIEYVEIEKECVCPKLPNDACISNTSKNDLISINTASFPSSITVRLSTAYSFLIFIKSSLMTFAISFLLPRIFSYLAIFLQASSYSFCNASISRPISL